MRHVQANASKNDNEEHRDATESLLQIVEDAVRRFVRQQRREPAEIMLLEFVNDQLWRSTDSPIDLGHTLELRLAEELCRRRVVSAVHYLLLLRTKLGGRVITIKNPDAALRHDVQGLNALMKLADVPIHIDLTREGHYTMAFDPQRVTSNVIEAKKLVAEAHGCLTSSDSAGALRRAAHALTIDPDALHAALVIVNVIKHGQEDPGRSDLLGAELCLARAILRYTASSLRLSAAGGHRSIQSLAWGRAQRYIAWLSQGWAQLQSAPFGNSPFDRYEVDSYRKLLAAIVEMAIAANAHMGITRRTHRTTQKKVARSALNEARVAYDRFVAIPEVIKLAEQLVRRHWPGADATKCEETALLIRAQLCPLVLVSGWLPVATSLEHFEEQFVTMFERRVDWSVVKRRIGRRAISFQEKFYRSGEGDEKESDERNDDEGLEEGE